jgi:hypothetical protein
MGLPLRRFSHAFIPKRIPSLTIDLVDRRKLDSVPRKAHAVSSLFAEDGDLRW